MALLEKEAFEQRALAFVPVGGPGPSVAGMPASSVPHIVTESTVALPHAGVPASTAQPYASRSFAVTGVGVAGSAASGSTVSAGNSNFSAPATGSAVT